MTIFMSFQLLMGRIRAGSARFASAVSQRTWVVRGSLSNRQVLIGCPTRPTECQKSCKIRAKVAPCSVWAHHRGRSGREAPAPVTGTIWPQLRIAISEQPAVFSAAFELPHPPAFVAIDQQGLKAGAMAGQFHAIL